MDQPAIREGARRNPGEIRLGTGGRRLIRLLARAGLIALLALALASLFVAAGCGRRDESPGGRTPAIAPYVSTATGFRFAPPPVWQADRYLVSEVTGEAARARVPGALSIAEVLYQPADFAQRPEVLLRIHVFPESTWTKLGQAGSASWGGEIARARGRVYLAATPQANPYPRGSADANLFDSMHLAIADVKRWLSVADAASDLASEFLPGSPTFGPAPVMYLGRLPAVNTGYRDVKVIFRADSSALFSSAYAGKGVLNQKGRWSLQGVYVRLEVLDDRGQPKESPFIWAIRDSVLAPVTWDRNAYGPVGLALRLRP